MVRLWAIRDWGNDTEIHYAHFTLRRALRQCDRGVQFLGGRFVPFKHDPKSLCIYGVTPFSSHQ